VGATEAALDEVEATIGCALAPEHRALLRLIGGSVTVVGAVHLEVFDVEMLVDAQGEVPASHPGLVVFACDGDRSLLGYDTRDPSTGFPVVLLDPTSAGWHEALYQASSIAEVLATRSNGLPLRYDKRYRHG